MIEIISLNHDTQIRGGRDTRLVDLYTHDKRVAIATLIGEEFPEDSLKAMGIERTLPKAIAEKMGIEHRYCDLSEEERIQVGGRRPEEFADQRAYHDYLNSFRENHWYERIKDRIDEHVAFFCGGDHIQTFAELLIAKGAEVKYSQEEVESYQRNLGRMH